MEPLDFVYNTIYKQSKSQGASEVNAHQQAVIGSEKFRKNAFAGKAHQMISEQIKKAVKMTKMERK